MLEVKLKEIIETNLIDVKEGIQFWQDKNGSRLITVHIGPGKVRAYCVNDEPRAWAEDTISDFEEKIIGEMGFRECNEDWEEYVTVKEPMAKDIRDIVEIKGVNYWKSKDGVLYMTIWNRLHGIDATLIPMNITTSRPVVYPRPVNMLDEMKRLNLYKVPNMRLEEF